MRTRAQRRRPSPQAPPRPDLRHEPVAAHAALLGAFFLSGATALGLEMTWLRLLGLSFGSESVGVLGVLAGFFGGLALGAVIVHRRILGSRAPALVYAGCESAIALYAVLSPFVLVAVGTHVPAAVAPIVGDNRSLLALVTNLGLAGLVLLPATLCMGATVPALVEAWRRVRSRDANRLTVGWLYAANTAGATAGVVVTTYWILPRLGTQLTTVTLALLSLIAGGLAWRWHSRQAPAARVVPSTPATEESARKPTPVRESALEPAPRLYVLLVLTGLAGIGLEVIGTFVLGQMLHNTVYTFANILAVYLVGTALGAWLYTQPVARRLRASQESSTGILLYGLLASSLLSAWVLAQSPDLVQRLAPAGAGHAEHVLSEVVVTALAFLLPTIWMGALFSHLVGQFTERGVGRAYALNTVGAAAAPFVFGLVLLPRLGPTATYYTVSALYAGLFLLVQFSGRRRTGWTIGGLTAAGILGAVTASSLVLVRLPAGATAVAERPGLHGMVFVTEARAGQEADVRILQVNQHFLMGGANGFVESRMGLLPIALGEEPANALFLGVGTGITAGAAVSAGVERVTAVELVPEIVDLLPWFDAQNHGLHQHPRVALRVSDARRFLRAATETYDLIVADLYHPGRDGAGFLYTREHFAAARRRLSDRGLFVQWLPLHQLGPRDLQTIVRTYLDVFPEAFGLLGNYSGRVTAFGLAGRLTGDGPGLDPERVSALLKNSDAGQVFDGLPDVLASFMLDSRGLREFAGSGPLNTDLTPRILFDAAEEPDLQFNPDLQWRALAALLPYRRAFPDDFIRAPDRDTLAALRASATPYGQAVTHYLAGEILRLERGSEGLRNALDEYITAYTLHPAFAPVAARLMELCLEQPHLAHDVVSRMAAVPSTQLDLAPLQVQLSGVHDPARVRQILVEFIRASG